MKNIGFELQLKLGSNHTQHTNSMELNKMMLPLKLQVTGYNKDRNHCEAKLEDGQLVTFDPFVTGAIELSMEDYEAGNGADLIGQSFLLTDFGVMPWAKYDDKYHYMILPREDGLIMLISNDKLNS